MKEKRHPSPGAGALPPFSSRLLLLLTGSKPRAPRHQSNAALMPQSFCSETLAARCQSALHRFVSFVWRARLCWVGVLLHGIKTSSGRLATTSALSCSR